MKDQVAASATQEEPLSYLCRKDPQLADLIRSLGPISYSNTRNVFEDVVSCILDMRIHYAPSHAAFRYPRLKKILKGKPLQPSDVQHLSEEVLLELKLSRQKHNSLKLWADQWIDKEMDDVDWYALEDSEVREQLVQVKGVSDWTVQMVLMFTLERPDIFPVSDYQLAKSMAEVYGLGRQNPLKAMEKTAELWRPYRSLAVMYFWQWRRSGKRQML